MRLRRGVPVVALRELHVLIELWCAAYCVISLLCVRLFVRGERWYRNGLMLLFVFVFVSSVSDVLSVIYDGLPGTVAYVATHVFNALTYVATFATAGAFTAYLCARIDDGTGRYDAWVNASWGICAIGMVLTIFGMFYSIDPVTNMYSRSQLYWVSQAMGGIIQIGNLVVVISARKHINQSTFLSMLIYIILPIIALSAQFPLGGLNITHLAMTVSLMVLFLDLQMRFADTLAKQKARLAIQERELSESRVQIMVSQIQPHFLYNTLDAIYYLCRKDPNKAREAISMFSDYLRMNLRSLAADKPVAFKVELDHVMNYLELERMSSDDTINFEVDIQADAFEIPALSLQPLVENAVKHGLGGKPGGGTVRLTSREVEDGFQIVVADDGVGFDTQAAPDTSRPHVGVQNVRQRLEAMCGGTLEIKSVPGEGTESIVWVPKKGSRS